MYGLIFFVFFFGLDVGFLVFFFLGNLNLVVFLVRILLFNLRGFLLMGVVFCFVLVGFVLVFLVFVGLVVEGLGKLKGILKCFVWVFIVFWLGVSFVLGFVEGVEVGVLFVLIVGNFDVLIVEVLGGYRVGNVSIEELISVNGMYVNERSIGGCGSGCDLWYCFRNVCVVYRCIRVGLFIYY